MQLEPQHKAPRRVVRFAILHQPPHWTNHGGRASPAVPAFCSSEALKLMSCVDDRLTNRWPGVMKG